MTAEQLGWVCWWGWVHLFWEMVPPFRDICYYKIFLCTEIMRQSSSLKKREKMSKKPADYLEGHSNLSACFSFWEDFYFCLHCHKLLIYARV
jgi:hypothetical protein